MNKLTRKLNRQTGFTHGSGSHPVSSRAYCEAFTEAPAQAYIQALPDILYVGGVGCHHSAQYTFNGSCSLCFLRFAFEGEFPGQIHHSKTLADNGNPQQTGKFQSHIQVVEGLEPPKPGQSLISYRRSRASKKTKPAEMFPVTSALWELMGYQPPLAIPLIGVVSGYSEPKVAEGMGISLYNLHERLFKGVKLTLQWIR